MPLIGTSMTLPLTSIFSALVLKYVRVNGKRKVMLLPVLHSVELAM